MGILTCFLLFVCMSVIVGQPVDQTLGVSSNQEHSIGKRFIDPSFGEGTEERDGIVKIRTKRSYSECEKLQLCKLHARSRNSFFAAYELYFVNKENAKLWDHRARTVAECEERFGDCYE